MKITGEGDSYRIDGAIDESAEDALNAFVDGFKESTLQLDVGGVHHLNSTGAGFWVNFLDRLKSVEVTLSKCTVPFIGYCNVSRNFLGHAKIKSFEYPVFCPECDHSATRLLENSDEESDFGPCEKCKTPMEAEIEADLYLSFRQ